MAEAYSYATRSIENLLNEHPADAARILASCYRKDKEVKDEIDSILQLSRSAQMAASRSATNSAIPTLSRGQVRGQARSSNSQAYVSAPNRRKGTQSDAGMTPPASSISRSSTGASASGESILFIDVYEDVFEEHPVRLKEASIKYSLIREDIANERIKSTEATEGDVHHVLIPETSVKVRIFKSVTLSWRRPKSANTHRTAFFLVSRDVLHTGVLLGYEDSGEGSPAHTPGSPIAIATQAPRQESYPDVKYQQEVSPRIEMPLSYHRSQFEPVLSPHEPSQHSVDRVDYHPVRPPSAATVLNARSTRTDHLQSIQVHISVSGNEFETPDRRLRLSLKWDKTPVNLWLDLDGPANAFFQELQKASRRKQVHNWDLYTIYLMTKSQLLDDSAYRLSLNTEELDADWEITVRWLDENKSDKSPHICGVVETEGD